MVLDNADDLDTFFARPISTVAEREPTLPLKDYLPQSSRGLLLITTRDKRMSARLAGRQASVVVHPMSYPEAQELLESQMGHPESLNTDDSKTLIDALEYMPLAITQAAAFISENNITLTEYLEMFFTNDSDVQDLLDKDHGDRKRDSESHNSAIRTWKMSFDLIRNQNPRAAEILSLMAVLDRQGIPKSLLQKDTDRLIDITTALGTLQAFSLINTGSDGQGYGLHRLVQLATRRWLEMQGTIKLWEEKALLVVADHFPISNFENWTTCECLLAHAQAVIQRKDISETYPVEYSTLLHNVACMDMSQGRYEIACTRLLTTTELHKKIFGLEHPDTLSSMANLANVYMFQERWEEAEKLQVQVIEANSRLCNPEDPDMLKSINFLVQSYIGQNQLDKAEELGVKTMETSLRVLKAVHSVTQASMATLSLVYWYQGRWDEAEELEVQILETMLGLHGSEHPETLVRMQHLAFRYYSQGRHREAIALMKDVVDKQMKAIGASHPATKDSVNALEEWLETRIC